jgi:single-strand DNA-binding protein
MNKVQLIGRVTSDITINQSKNGIAVCSFSVAIDRYIKDKEKSTDFIRCNAFGSTAEVLGKYAGKGKQIAIEGNIKTGSYEKDGVKHYTQDVQVERVELLGSKSDSSTSSQAEPTQAAAPQTNANDFEPLVEDSEVPF